MATFLQHIFPLDLFVVIINKDMITTEFEATRTIKTWVTYCLIIIITTATISTPPLNKRSAFSETGRHTVHSTVAPVQGQSRALGLYPQRNWVPDLSAICPKCRFNPGQPAEEGNQLGALICCYHGLGVMKVALLNYSGVQRTNK